MSVPPYGLSFTQDSEGTYTVIYNDLNKPPKNTIEYTLYGNTSITSNKYKYTSQTNLFCLNSLLQNPFSLQIFKQNFNYTSVYGNNFNISAGDLLIGNKYGDGTKALNIFNGTDGGLKNTINTTSSLYNCIIYPKGGGQEADNSILTTNYNSNQIIYYNSQNNYIGNSYTLKNHIHFFTVDPKGNMYIIYDNSVSNQYIFAKLTPYWGTQNIEIESITTNGIFYTNSVFINSIRFDNENFMYASVTLFPNNNVNQAEFYIYKFQFDGTMFKIVKNVNNNYLINYTPYVNTDYIKNTTGASNLETYSIDFDNDNYIYLSVVGNANGYTTNTANSYNILKFDPYGNIIDEKFLIFNVSNAISEYVSFAIYNDSLYFLSSTSNQILKANISNTPNYYTFPQVQLKIGNNVLSIKSDTINVADGLDIYIPFSIPDTPLMTNATYDGSNITISWNNNINSGGNYIKGYYLYYSTDGYNYTKINNIIATNTNTCIYNTLVKGTTYYFYVTAVNDGNLESNASYTDAISIMPCNNPTPVTNTSISSTDVYSINIKWTQLNDTNSGCNSIIGYNVYYSQTTNPSNPSPSNTILANASPITSTSNEYTITGLLPSTVYYIWVTAVNDGLKESLFPNSILSGSTQEQQYNYIPSNVSINLVLSVSKPQFKLKWTPSQPPTNTQPSGFNIYMNSTNNKPINFLLEIKPITITSGTAIETTIDMNLGNLKYGETYYFWITALGTGDQTPSDPSKVVSSIYATYPSPPDMNDYIITQGINNKIVLFFPPNITTLSNPKVTYVLKQGIQPTDLENAKKQAIDAATIAAAAAAKAITSATIAKETTNNAIEIIQENSSSTNNTTAAALAAKTAATTASSDENIASTTAITAATKENILADLYTSSAETNDTNKTGCNDIIGYNIYIQDNTGIFRKINSFTNTKTNTNNRYINIPSNTRNRFNFPLSTTTLLTPYIINNNSYYYENTTQQKISIQNGDSYTIMITAINDAGLESKINTSSTTNNTCLNYDSSDDEGDSSTNSYDKSQFTITPYGRPSPPYDISYTNSSNILAWKKPTITGGSDSLIYNVFYSTEQSITHPIATGALSIIHNNIFSSNKLVSSNNTSVDLSSFFDGVHLSYGTPYNFYVIAQNSKFAMNTTNVNNSSNPISLINAIGGDSTVASLYITPYKQPDPPSSISISQDGNNWKINWLPPTTKGGSYIIQYNIYDASNAPNYILLNSVVNTSRSYTIPNIDTTLSYTLCVTAVNEGQLESDYSTVGTFPPTTPKKTTISNISFVIPSKPLQLKYTIAKNVVTLVWSRPLSIGGGNFINYKIYKNKDPIPIATTSDTKYDININIAQGATFTIGAVNDGGLSSPTSDPVIVDTTTTTTDTMTYAEPTSICFREGTKILCRVTDKEDTYLPIERITDNTYVKTWQHGYKRVKYVLQSTIDNSPRKTINKLYKMSSENHPSLIEDLYVTGSHAILYDSLTDKQEDRMEALIDHFNIDYAMVLDGKRKLIAYYDDNFQEWNETNTFGIYHLVLESKTAHRNYGIYANGILVESTDEITMSRMNQYSLVNQGFKLVDYDTKQNITHIHKVNGILESKLEQHKKKITYNEEDLIKKKQSMEEEKERRERKQEEIIRMVVQPNEKKFSTTQRRHTASTANFTMKHYI